MLKVNNPKIILNALSSVFQMTLTGVIFFFLYRYLEIRLDSEELGIWSLVIATSSITNLANFGIAASLVKFVAEYIGTNRKREVAILVSTAFTSVFLFFLILITLIYIVALLILKNIIDEEYFYLAKGILPFTLISLFITGMSSVFSSTLEGMQKNYIKNIIYSFAIVALLLFTLLFTPDHGIYGVVYAQVFQSILILLSSFFFTIKFVFIRGIKFQIWNKEKFREIIGYGVKFQVISFCQMLYEPTTKMLLNVFGGLTLVWYYEMASRLVSQARSLVVNTNSVLIPVITEASLKNKNSLESIYKQSISLLINIAIPLMIGIVFFSPIISKLWIGEIQNSFIIFCAILVFGSLLNIFSNPAYFGFLGQGILNPIVIQHIVLGIVNLILSYFLGYFFGGYGVVFGWGFSLATISYIAVFKYDKINNFDFLKIFIKELDSIVMGIFLFLLSLYLVFFQQQIYEKHFLLTCSIQSIIFISIFGFILLKKINFKFADIKAKLLK